jgi:sialidase-1
VLENALADPDRAEEFVVRDDGVCADVGYPWAVQLADGSVLLAYYWTNPQGRRQILGSWLEI